MYGVTNVVLATYKIFNLSDTKPKFLVYKQHTVTPNAYERTDTAVPLQLKFMSKEVHRADVESVDGQCYVNAEVEVADNGLPLYPSNSFTLRYNSSVLQYAGYVQNGFTANGLNQGAVRLQTFDESARKFVIKFKIKDPDNVFGHSARVDAEFKIEDVQYYFSNFEIVTSVKVQNG